MSIDKIIGSSDSIKKVKEMILKVAPSDINVLILGESGTGKELVAQAIHQHSKRGESHFVPINCGAIPRDLLESELFGHEKGAFTGAIATKKGRFEMAERGSIFLDEIGDMPIDMQVKILRVLQERAYERVGGLQTFPTNVRIVAATHRELEAQIKQGNFREDLFYRLNVFPIELPALRERTEDIPLLLESFFEQFDLPPSLTDEATNILMQYNWPGNIRELINLAERLNILFPGEEVGVENLPVNYIKNINPAKKQMAVQPIKNAAAADEEIFTTTEIDKISPNLSPVIGLENQVLDIEKKIIYEALEKSDNNIEISARFLDLSKDELLTKIKDFGLDLT